jgi:hypothetical protein
VVTCADFCWSAWPSWAASSVKADMKAPDIDIKRYLSSARF